jgi:hypothetical protein
MKAWARLTMGVALSVVLFWVTTARADSVLQLNLSDMTGRAAKVFRGRLASASAGTVDVGGVTLPTVTYRFHVDEAFRGSFSTVKGVTFAEFTTIGKVVAKRAGSYKSVAILPQMPKLRKGESYLLFVTEPSRVGLSTTVGLGQGAFALTQVGGVTMASNEVKNRGLFRGMNGLAATSSGPIPYDVLAGQVRTLIRSR